jgi:DNA-binding NarL/FixJ family response regulator
MSSNTDEVVRKLDVLIRLVAVGICADKTQKEKIQILAGVGLAPKEIADFVGTTPNTVSVSLSTMKREKTKQKGRTAKKRRAEMATPDVPEPVAAEE